MRRDRALKSRHVELYTDEQWGSLGYRHNERAIPGEIVSSTTSL